MRAPLVALSLAVPGVLLGTSCTKLTPVNLTAVEPCGQENQALNGVKSFLMLSNGAEPDDISAFKATEAGGFAIGLGEQIIVTIQGFSEDITLVDQPTAPGVPPKAVGRTVPMAISDTTAAVRGTVLVGKVDAFGSPRDVEGNCSAMENGSAVEGRHGHTATYIPGVNKVLIYGGAVWVDDGTGTGNKTESFLRTAEIYDPVTGFFTPLPEITPARAYHTATALPDGRVAIWGGFSTIGGATTVVGSVQLVDVRVPENPYPNPILATARAHHTATLLADVGMIVAVGGCAGGPAAGCTPSSASDTSTNVVPNVEVLNINNLAAASPFTDGGALTFPRAMHQAVAFPGGEAGLIAVVGGLNGAGALRSVEVLRVAGDTVETVAGDNDALSVERVRHQAALFDPQTRTFIVSGGQAQAPNGVLSDTAPGDNTVELCSLIDAVVTCTPDVPMQSPRYGHAMANLRDGTFVVMGGVVPTGTSTAEARRRAPGTNELSWVATAGALTVPRERAAVTLLGADSLGVGFINQIFYSGGHSTASAGTPKTTSNATDIYFGP